MNFAKGDAAGAVPAQVTGDPHRYSAAEIRERVNLVQELMRGVMKEGTHYGTIPGTPKPTLYKAGAELLCLTFRVATAYKVEDLGDASTARYRVTCIGTHQVTDVAQGEGVAECSSAEDQYKWRRAACAEEFDLTPKKLRRLKFVEHSGSVSKAIQVRTETADQANTVLKMACKRAMVAMTLTATAASDIFTQDIEDMPGVIGQTGAGTVEVGPLAAKWVAKANSARSPAELAAVWHSGTKEINDAKDVKASTAFKAAVTAKEIAFKGCPP